MASVFYNAPALRAGIRLVKALAESKRPLGLSDIAREANTNKNKGWVSMRDAA